MNADHFFVGFHTFEAHCVACSACCSNRNKVNVEDAVVSINAYKFTGSNHCACRVKLFNDASFETNPKASSEVTRCKQDCFACRVHAVSKSYASQHNVACAGVCSTAVNGSCWCIGNVSEFRSTLSVDAHSFQKAAVRTDVVLHNVLSTVVECFLATASRTADERERNDRSQNNLAWDDRRLLNNASDCRVDVECVLALTCEGPACFVCKHECFNKGITDFTTFRERDLTCKRKVLRKKVVKVAINALKEVNYLLITYL